MTTSGRIATLIAALGLSVFAYNRFDDVETIDIIPSMSEISPIFELPTPIYEAESVLVKLDPKEFECMRLNVYHEARNQSISGQEAVAQVTWNRTKVSNGRFPKTVCGVVYQRAQFSWTHTLRNHQPNLNNPIEAKAWEIAGEVAAAALRGELTDRVGDATFYHATYVNPSWAYSNRMKRVAQIDTHIFYKDVKLSVNISS